MSLTDLPVVASVQCDFLADVFPPGRIFTDGNICCMLSCILCCRDFGAEHDTDIMTAKAIVKCPPEALAGLV